MPFSRSSTWTASTISLDIPSSLQQVAALDVGVRDRDNPVVGGDGHLAVGRADQLAGEALAPAVLSLGAHARAARRSDGSGPASSADASAPERRSPDRYGPGGRAGGA